MTLETNTKRELFLDPCSPFVTQPKVTVDGVNFQVHRCPDRVTTEFYCIIYGHIFNVKILDV